MFHIKTQKQNIWGGHAPIISSIGSVWVITESPHLPPKHRLIKRLMFRSLPAIGWMECLLYTFNRAAAIITAHEGKGNMYRIISSNFPAVNKSHAPTKGAETWPREKMPFRVFARVDSLIFVFIVLEWDWLTKSLLPMASVLLWPCFKYFPPLSW